MSTNLPKTIETYFRALNIYDSELLAECFTEDATFKDEGKEYQGPDAIKAHIIEINNNPKVETVVTNSVDLNGETIVTAIVSGNFDGSPIQLNFHFTLANQKITLLNIVLAGE
ncbi:nuclear transport factor 2 family protein [Marasmitruncus massiliensis]|uniref:nuclear transport factor 2 family protein n=1 Tax=Marasmitruncus massiliensis TaxID=1944642 RepID=UPI000C7D9253|nr:nuclear transport factor 2 family protein [Marasmitruncus massiliensis]